MSKHLRRKTTGVVTAACESGVDASKVEGTKVYSNDEEDVVFEGDVDGTSYYDNGTFMAFSDGTMLEGHDDDDSVYRIKVLRAGELFIGITVHESSGEDDDAPTDIATFRPGLKWARVSNDMTVIE